MGQDFGLGVVVGLALATAIAFAAVIITAAITYLVEKVPWIVKQIKRLG